MSFHYHQVGVLVLGFKEFFTCFMEFESDFFIFVVECVVRINDIPYLVHISFWIILVFPEHIAYIVYECFDNLRRFIFGEHLEEIR